MALWEGKSDLDLLHEASQEPTGHQDISRYSFLIGFLQKVPRTPFCLWQRFLIRSNSAGEGNLCHFLGGASGLGVFSCENTI